MNLIPKGTSYGFHSLPLALDFIVTIVKQNQNTWAAKPGKGRVFLCSKNSRRKGGGAEGKMTCKIVVFIFTMIRLDCSSGHKARGHASDANEAMPSKNPKPANEKETKANEAMPSCCCTAHCAQMAREY